MPEKAESPVCSGTFVLYFAFDVADRIPLDQLYESTQPALIHPQGPLQQVEIAGKILAEPMPDLALEDATVHAAIHYYESGVIGVICEIPYSCSWDELVLRTSQWVAAPQLERYAESCMKRGIAKTHPALVNPYPEPLREDYCVVQLNPLETASGPMPASELIAQFGPKIAQLIRTESQVLSADERAEVLRGSISYYPCDLLVAGWNAALVYDTARGAQPTLRLLEIANVQLLELRHYDDLLSEVLARAYDTLEAGSGFFRRWTLARDAQKLNAMLMEVREITERMDNSVKFLSDMYASRLYRLAAARIGVPDYRKLVEDKLTDASHAYTFMIDQFHTARSFVLEAVVVIILLIELGFLFGGKR